MIRIDFYELDEIISILNKAKNDMINVNNYIRDGNKDSDYYIETPLYLVDNITSITKKIVDIQESIIKSSHDIKSAINTSDIDELRALTFNTSIINNNKTTELNEIETQTYSRKIYTVNDSGNFIFNEETYGLYGGAQESLTVCLDSYIESPNPSALSYVKVENMINLIKHFQIFPIPSLTDIANVFELFENTGCFYIAISNLICSFFSTIPNGEEIFYQKFGYPLCWQTADGAKYYNYETIALDIYLFRYKHLSSINELLDNGEGVSATDFETFIPEYFQSKGINLNYEIHDCNMNILNDNESFYDTVNEELGYFQAKEIQYLIIGARNYDLISNSPYTSNSYELGGHAVLVTEINDNNELTVSSWGNKYQLDYKNVASFDDSYFTFYYFNLALTEEN